MDNPPDLIHLFSVNFDGFWRWIIRQTDNPTLVWIRPLQTNDVGEGQISVRSVWHKSTVQKNSTAMVICTRPPPPPPSPLPRVTNKFHGFQYKKSRERSIFVIDQLKGIQSPKQGEWKGCYLSIEGTRKGYLFSWKKKKKKKKNCYLKG